MGFKDNRNSQSNGIYNISTVNDSLSPSNINNHLSVNFGENGDKPPASPQLNINRVAYNLPNFNARFRRASQIAGARPKSMTSEKMLEKVKPECKSPLEILKTLFPIIGWLSKYKKKDLVPDVVSGITIAVFQVPESMGYSLLAQLPPIYCLYSSFFPLLMYAILGTSRHCSVGTFAALTIMTGAIIQKVQEDIAEENENIMQNAVNNNLPSNSTETLIEYSNVQIAIMCGFTVGVYQLLFGFLRLGFVSVYMSEQFLNGFTCSVAYHVLGSQFQHMFGIKVENQSGLFTLAKETILVVENITQTNIASLIMSVTCIIILLAFKCYINDWIKRKLNIKVPFPIEIFVVIGTVIISNVLNMRDKYSVRVVGHIERGLPAPEIPSLHIIKYIWLPCLPLAIVSYAITYSVGKNFAMKHDYEIDSSQELIALGGSNLFSSFFSCIPVGASLSRSAVQESSGGVTQLVSLVNCVGILAVLLYFGSFLEQLPNAVLATIISIALRILLLEVRLFKKYWDVDKIDGSIWLVTFLSVIILDIDYGLYIGLIWSLLTLIYKSQRPRTYLLGTVSDQMDVFVPIGKYINAREVPGIKIYQFCGPLHFANVDYFVNGLIQKMGFSAKEIRKKMAKMEKLEKSQQQNTYAKNCQTTTNTPRSRLSQLISSKENLQTMPKLPTYIIIDCSMFSYIDTNGVTTLKRTVQEYESVGIRTLLAGCASHVTKLLERDHFYAAVPAQHVYISIYDALQHAIAPQIDITVSNDNDSAVDLIIESKSFDNHAFEDITLDIDVDAHNTANHTKSIA